MVFDCPMADDPAMISNTDFSCGCVLSRLGFANPSYEECNHTWFCDIGPWPDAGFVRDPA
jgi:hypothetical protein